MEQRIPGLVTPEKKKRGCFFYGCLTAIALIVAGSFAVYFLVKSAINTLVMNYTVSAPAELPRSSVPEEQFRQLEARVGAFRQVINGDSVSPAELSLSGSDVNALIENDPDLKEVKGLAWVDIRDDRIRAKVNLPLDSAGFPGRFVVGEGEVSIMLERGILDIRLQQLALNGSAVPEEIMTEVRKENLAAGLYKKESNLDFLKKIDRIEVKNSLVTLGRAH